MRAGCVSVRRRAAPQSGFAQAARGDNAQIHGTRSSRTVATGLYAGH